MNERYEEIMEAKGIKDSLKVLAWHLVFTLLAGVALGLPCYLIFVFILSSER